MKDFAIVSVFISAEVSINTDLLAFFQKNIRQKSRFDTKKTVVETLYELANRNYRPRADARRSVDMKTAQTIHPSFRRSRWAAYLLAVGLTAFTLTVRVAIGSRFEGPTMIIFTIPVILNAYWGGIGPGLLSTVLSGLGAAYYILPPIYSFNVLSKTQRWQEVMLFLAGAIISFICETLHRSRRRAEKVIAELNQAEMASTQLAAIVESSDDAIISKDLNSVIITWNKGAEKIFGYAADEMIGTSIMRLIPADRHDEENQILAKIKRGENLDHFETRRQTKDGRLIDVSVTASPIKDASGRVVGVSKVARDITARKRAEESLQLLESAVQQSKESILITDAELNLPGPKIIFVNPAFTQMTGYTAEEAIGKTPRILQGPRTDKTVLSRLRHNLERGEVFAGEAINYRKDGEEFYLEWQIAPLRNASGKITHFVSTQHHITERKRAEEALRASETRLQTIVESLDEGVVVSDNSGQVLHFNHAALAMHGFASLDEIRLHLNEFANIFELSAWDGTLWPVDQWPLARVLHGEKLNDLEVHIRRVRSDWQRIFSYGGTLVRDAAGKPMLAVVTIRDITERKRADRRLVTQNAISRVLADSNTLNEATPKIIQAICESEGWDFGTIWEADKKSNKLRCLEIWRRPELQAEELEAKTRELTFSLNTGLPGRVWASGKPLLIPDIADDKNYPRASLAAKIGLNSAVAFPITVEGEVIGVIDFLGREIHTTDEEMLEMLLGIGRQIGSFFKRKIVEEQFRQSQKMEGIGQLASGVAHDFNNILGIIQLQSDLLKAEGGLSPAQSEFAEEISASTQRAAALTRQLLLFSRKEKLLLRELNLNESIGDMTKMLRRLLGEDIQLQFKFAMQPLFVNADAGMMDQVLMNLAVNARDAMSKGGKLIIETSAAEFDEAATSHSAQIRLGKFVCLSVSDTGCGIPRENLQKIFEPFFTTKEVGKGTGLGLATVFGIAQQHNGWVNVYSEVGQGTTLRIYLPRLARTSDQKFVAPMTEKARGGGETILLVEDEPRLRASVKNILSRLGYNVLEAANGIEALEIWKNHRNEVRLAQKVWNQQRDGIHLLLTDMVMPGGMTGKELGERLMKENPKLKVIYASGYSAEVAGKDFPLEEGVNFLTKPFQAQKLAQAIRSCLDKIGV